MKVNYDGITFDSELEIDYYKYLEMMIESEDVCRFIYHPFPIMVTDKNNYTPDFLVEYANRVEIIETKGYNQFSFQRDNLIHNIMKNKDNRELRNYVVMNGFWDINSKVVIYRKIKHLKSVGWVDFDWKNPNTQAKKNAIARDDARKENKVLSAQLKDFKRYFKYNETSKKLTKNQLIWLNSFKENNKELLNDN